MSAVTDRAVGAGRRATAAKDEVMSDRPRRVFAREFKLDICRRLVNGEVRISQVCREHALCSSVVESWRARYRELGEAAFTDPPTPAAGDGPPEQAALRAAHARIAALEAALGRAHLETELLGRALAASQAKDGAGPGGSCRPSAVR
jgi:transposase-like protein